MATAKGLTADLLAARREGLSYAAIAARFGITKQAAWERVTRAEKAAASPFERVVELRNSEKTAKQIEKATGLPPAVVLKHISAGIAAGRVARRVVSRREREPEILALRDAGKTTKQIAADLGISANVVREVIALAIEQGRARKLSREETLSRSRAGLEAYFAGKGKPAPAAQAVAQVEQFLNPQAYRVQKIDTVLRVIDSLPDDLQKVLANEKGRFEVNAWEEAHARGTWIGINARRFHVSQRYIDIAGFEEAIRTILTRETILPAETIAHDNRSFERDTGLAVHTLPPGYTADLGTVDTISASDVIAIVERPITEDHDDYLPEPERPATVDVKPRPAPALNAAYVAEVYYRHGLDEVRRRWPEVSDDALDEAIRVGRRMVAPPTDDLPKGWSTRIAGAIARLFGGRS